MMLLQTSSIRLRLLGCLTPSNNHIHHSTATSPAAQAPTEADPDAVSMQFMKSMIECTTSSENKAIFPSWDGSGADKTFFLEHIASSMNAINDLWLLPTGLHLSLTNNPNYLNFFF
jgi:hypothetical protein